MVRRDEEYATLGANVVVELNSESHARRPTTRAWAIIRRAERAQRHATDRQGRSERRQADRTSRTDRSYQAPAQVQEREVITDAGRQPANDLAGHQQQYSAIGVKGAGQNS